MHVMFHSRPRRSLVALTCMVVAAAVWVLFAGEAERTEWSTASAAALRRPTGQPQLVAYQPFPSMDGEMCQWVPASADTTSGDITMMASLQQQQLADRAATRTVDDPGTAVDADRAPVRVIRDTYPTYAAVAVDTNSNEVYLQDENLFGYKVFNRLDNTPPGAAFTEPKRIVGGVNTRMEFNCGLYVDPNTGDVYSVNNDTQDTMVIFPREAQGNVLPKRQLHTPHRTWGIAVDEAAQELYLTVQHPPKVVVYRKMAEGEEEPLRTLEGPSTRLEDAHGIAIDTKNQWMFISNHGNASNPRIPGGGTYQPPSISVYPLKAAGDVAPLRVIAGPNTRLNWPAAMFLDQERGDLYLANDTDDSILVFRVTDSGNVAPTRVIRGPKTGIKNPTGIFLDLKNEELWVSNMGNHSATVFPLDANGDVAPLRTIRSAPAGKVALAIGNPGAAGYDSKREQILVPN